MQSPHLATHLVAGLNARAKWKARDFDEAFKMAAEAAELARDAGDELAWWNMRYLQAECSVTKEPSRNTCTGDLPE